MHSLIQAIRPPPAADKNEITTTRNVQRALAARVQDLSAAFRKKQKVYMQRESSPSPFGSLT
jgi:syntaxin 16